MFFSWTQYLLEKHKEQIRDIVVVRLNGTGRKGLEKIIGKSWNQVVAAKDKDVFLPEYFMRICILGVIYHELFGLAQMLSDLETREYNPLLL
jgi:hypothetical protein